MLYRKNLYSWEQIARVASGIALAVFVPDAGRLDRLYARSLRSGVRFDGRVRVVPSLCDSRTAPEGTANQLNRG